MRILRNYILKECILPFFLALGVLSCVFLLGYTVKLAHLVINKGVPLSSVSSIFLLLIPILLAYTIPLACLISIILTFSRLSTDNEIIAIRTAGIKIGRLIRPLFTIGFLLSLTTFLLNDRVIPYAYHRQRTLEKSLGSENPTALLEPGVFISAFKGQTAFIHKVEDNQLSNVTIWQDQKDGRPPRTIFAKHGEFSKTPDNKQLILKLMNGTSDESDPNDPNAYYKLNFKTLFITLDIAAEKKIDGKKPKGMTIAELTEEIKQLEKRLIDTAPLKTELYRRITWSFAPLIFTLLGFPLAVITNRRERSTNVIIAFIAAATYYLLSLGCQALSIEQILPASLIMWMPDLLGALAVIILTHKLCAS